MTKLQLRGKDLIDIGFPEGRVIGVAINAMTRHHKRTAKYRVLELLSEVLADPERFAGDKILGEISELLLKQQKKAEIQAPVLRPEPLAYHTYGADNIDESAIEQMRTAMRLPITVAGALMPDAHGGYGLPIGGVLAADNAVIPYGVGMDIGCRMCLSVFDLPVQVFAQDRERLRALLLDHTRFGTDIFERPMDDEVLHREEFKLIPKAKELRERARQQIGTSGSGNHFVEFGVVAIPEGANPWSLPAGKYVGLLSHSGSRGLGAGLAQHYTKLAMSLCQLPQEARHLAWLYLDTEEGQEYWQAMTLAGDYASACHHHIHHRIGKALGLEPLARVENHHNFAWKEQLADGREVIVHRKGATPAGKGALGIIPGSMSSPGYIVMGKGDPESINSASHGAGRLMSRRKAKATIDFGEFKKHLKESGIDLIGGGLDEAPFVYKDIRQVMACQSDLVDIIGAFTPKVVRMDTE